MKPWSGTPAPSRMRSRSTSLWLRPALTRRIDRLFARGSFYGEDRGNGTRLQINDTRIGQVTTGGERLVAGGTLSVRAFGSGQDYHQTFSAISADRTTERLTRLQ